VKNKFIVIVPVYNAVNYIEKCLTSIIFQDYENLEIYVIDDCSDDGTWDKILEVEAKYGHPLHLVIADRHKGTALEGVICGIKVSLCEPENIICIVDGDDSLIGTTVFSDLNDVYKDTEVYMTYGQFIPVSGGYGPYCKPIPDTRTYRKSGQWLANHLRTYKKKLWDMIDDRDLRDKFGRYYMASGDSCVLYPLIELCGHKHMRFVKKINYLYNDENPLNEFRVIKEYNLRIGEEIRNKECYPELP